jgi:ribosomal protein L37AE/L43A
VSSAEQPPEWLDDELRDALVAIAARADRHGVICPRCLSGRVNRIASRHGFCQPCERDHDARIRESKRRWWNDEQEAQP